MLAVRMRETQARCARPPPPCPARALDARFPVERPDGIARATKDVKTLGDHDMTCTRVQLEGVLRRAVDVRPHAHVGKGLGRGVHIAARERREASVHAEGGQMRRASPAVKGAFWHVACELTRVILTHHVRATRSARGLHRGRRWRDWR